MIYLDYKTMLLSSLPMHHAVLVLTNDRATSSAGLWDEIRTLSPAHKYFDQTVLDIETSREIISWAKNSYNDERIGIISFHTAGIPAQNALLKILEEPPLKTRFILITSNKDNLIETVLSRVQIHKNTNLIENHENAEIFLKTPPSLRMKLPYIVELLEKKDEGGRKDRESVREFILSLTKILSKKKGGIQDNSYVKEILTMASFASDPSASGKALLEYLSLLLPQTA
jgi:DNA polymerase III, delta subunit